MNINWVVADAIELDPVINVDQLKTIGSIWGGWRSWRVCQTDNVVCHEVERAQQLIDQKFQSRCNFYVPNSLYMTLADQTQLRAYEGNLAHQINHPDELIAMYLAATISDIVILLGFDWTGINSDQQEIDYRGLVAATMANNADTQWVLLDQTGPVRAELTKLPNFTQDTLANVLKTFAT